MDAVALLGLKQEELYEPAPVCPTGEALTAHSYNLWYNAMLQWQQEGTRLFDMVRPTLDLTGPHADQDLRRLRGWKCNDVRDGRALLQWALSFVDRSSVDGQMELLKQIGSMTLDPNETLFGLSEHLFKLWELWLDISSNDRNAPAAFLSQLLTSMPVAPEGPIVHVRRYLADLIRKKDSHLLNDIDGDKGLFANMIDYGKMLGLKDVPRSALNLLGSSAKPAGGPPAGGGKGGDDSKPDASKGDCNKCFAFACTKEARGSDGCICLHTSKFDTSKLTRHRKKYVELVRAYNKAHPGKSLKVAIKVVRDALDANESTKQLTFMTSVESVMGSKIDDPDELEAWLSDNGDKSFFTLGHTAGEGNLQFVVEECSGYDGEAESLAGSLHMMDASSGSMASATDAEQEVARLRAQLENANARLVALSVATPSTAARSTSPSLAPPAPPSSPAISQQRPHDPALTRPTPLTLGQHTPKQAWNRFLATPVARVKEWTMQHQPKFTPSTGTIKEDDGESGAELISRGLAKYEKNERTMRQKLKNKSMSNWIVIRGAAKIVLFWLGSLDAVSENVRAYWWDNWTMHGTLTVVLGIGCLAPFLRPLVLKAVAKLSKLMLAASVSQAKAVAERLRATMKTLVTALMTKLVAASAARIGLAVRALTDSSRTGVAVQAAPAPAPSATPVSTSTGTGAGSTPITTWHPNTPDAPAPADGTGDGTLMPLLALSDVKLGDSVMLASTELKMTDGAKPALMDNGASNGTSCTRSLDGAVPGTFRAADAGAIGIGSEGVALESKGSWLFVIERRGAKGSEIVVRRMKYTPKLPMYAVFSEANENVEHGYTIVWKAGEQRTMVSPSGEVIHLFMSKSNLGWLQIIPITDVDKQKATLAQYNNTNGTVHALHLNGQLSVKTLDPAAVRATGMGKTKPLRGMALLRRQHCIDGHPALPITVKNLKLMGAFDNKLVTIEHVKLFQEQGCASCETAKMRRRPFTIKVEPLDPTKPVVGKCWVFDALELRVPDINSGVTLAYAVVEKVSGMALVGGMAGYSEQNVLATLNEVRARVRPVHGEIQILRADSHPTHRSAGVRDYMIANQMVKQLSPPYIHEGVGKVENFFLVAVPSANALLTAAPDLGENHFLQALRYVAHSRNFSVTSNSNPPQSPAMVYFNTKEYRAPGLQVFGAAAKALVHGEARDSKFDEHSRPCVYMGPAVNSDSVAHCAVFFDKKYLDVDVGCLAVDDHVVLERTQRDHPDAQPYNQVGGAKTVDVGKPVSIFDLSGFTYKTDDLPKVQPIIWVRSCPLPREYMVLLLWHGELRAGDMASWVYELGATKIVPIPIDIKIGGQEHNLARKPIKDSLLMTLKQSVTLGAFFQPECSPFSAARFKRPGPPVLFDSDHPDGIPDEDGEVPDEVMQALATVKFVADLFRAGADSEKSMGLEFPASQGTSSPFAAEGREKHSTIADTSIMRSVTQELKLELIYSEQGAAGASTRKPTAMLATPRFAAALARTVGTLTTSPGDQTVQIVGTDESGHYRSSASEVYTPEYAMRITIALLGSIPKVLDLLKDDTIGAAGKASTDDLFPVGTIVEIYWYGEQTWFKAIVLETEVRKGKVHGNIIPRREIKVRYYADNKVMWHALCECSVRDAPIDDLPDEEFDMPSGGTDEAAVAMLLDDRPSITLERVDGGDFLANLINIDATPQWPTDDDADALSAMPTMLDDKNAADALLAAHFGIDDASNPNQAMTEEGKQAGMLHAHVGEMLTAREVVIDLEDETVVSNAALFVVLDNLTVQKIDTKEAHKWHCPNNEREFNQSPQRALWQTAKELKMDEYQKLNMYELVKRSDVDEKKHTIYKTLWAYKIKFEEDGLTFNKLNPRWCVRGGTMDRDMFKSYAEMMRATSMNIGWGLKGEFFKQLIDALLDLGNAFQSTRTVDKDNKQLEGEPEFYTEQAPGFKKYGPNGEELVCKQHCFMQGRIDATAGFDKALTKILVEECGMTSMVWDKKVFIFNTTKLAGTTASLHDIIAEATRVVADGEDSGPQQVPIGWAWFACHVDDLQALATGLHCRVNNRILVFVRGTISVSYACKYTGWHGNKTLGYGVALCEENETVTITAAGALKAIHEKLFSKADFKATPRHIVTEAVYDRHPGEVPLEGDPLRPEYLMRQALVRSVLGACIWASQAYPAIASGINAMCVDMSNPGDARLGQLRHMFMHLGANPPGKTFGGKHITAVGGDYDDVTPFTPGAKDGRYHFFSDASINVTGGIGMFNGCCIQNYCLRQHLQSPDAHTSELVAAGSNIHAIVPVNGLLQEIGLRRGRPTTTYFDSISTVFVASSDAAPKKSVWLARRTKVVTEAVELDEIKPVHIKEYDMVADSCTKYIKRDTWARHMHYVLNLPGDPPNCNGDTKLNAA